VNGPVGKPLVLAMTAMAFSQGITVMQTLGIFLTLLIPWPNIVRDFLDWMRIFNLDVIDLLKLQCAYGSDQVLAFIMGALIFPYTIFAFGVLFIVGRFFIPTSLARWKWELTKTINAEGAFMQAAYSAVAQRAVLPLICFLHPMGDRTVMQMPSLVCSSSEYIGVLIAGLGLLFLCLAFYAVAVYAVCVAPATTIKCAAFAGKTKFLMFRFRADKWYWGCVLIPRGLAISLVAVIFPDEVHAQIFSTGTLLALYFGVMVSAWPWKVPLLNVADMASCFLMLLLVMSAASFTPKAVGDLADALNVLMIVILLALYGTVVLIISMSLCAFYLHSDKAVFSGGQRDAFGLGTAMTLAILVGRLERFTICSQTWLKEDLTFALGSWLNYDLVLIDKMLSAFESYGMLTYDNDMTRVPNRISTIINLKTPLEYDDQEAQSGAAEDEI